MTAATPFPNWFTSRLPDSEEVSLGRRLAALAAADPDRAFVVSDDGTAASRAEVQRAVADTAGWLRGLGVAPGDRVLVWMPTSPDMVRIIFAIASVGATIVPLNTSLRGQMLANTFANANAAILFCHPGLVDRLADVDCASLKTVVLPGAETGAVAGLDVVAEESLARVDAPPATNQPWDIAAIIYSSGTTGPSKGVRIPFAQVWTLSQVFYGFMQADDRMLLMYPLFHIAGFSALFAVVQTEASMAVTEAFKASDFWEMLRRTGSTTTPGLGPTFISILEKPEPAPSDRDNPLRHFNAQAMTPQARAFAERFGCTTMGSYSMTETSGLCVSGLNEGEDGRVGRPRDGIELRVVDENDVEVPSGTPGEVIVRATLPWTLNAGYHDNPEATAAAWRNGWFHTGDYVRRDAEGNIFFVDRVKDVIRRRSENISSSEVELEVRAFAAVQDAAAIGVRADGDDEVLVVVTAVPGRTIDPKALIDFLVPRMPHFMVPRFVRIVNELPKTHTNRVQKPALREIGLLDSDWDRVSAGIVLRGQRLATR